jgi:gamma-glutamylputrescine oxidase
MVSANFALSHFLLGHAKMKQSVNFPVTWYEATASRGAGYPRLRGPARAEVCVIGGGLAGLTACLELARQGKKVVLLEGSRVAWAASGRNGGFVSSGFAENTRKIFDRVGGEAARALYSLSARGTDYVRSHATQTEIKMGDGLIVAQRYRDRGGLREYREFMQRELAEDLQYQSVAETRALLNSARYFESLRNPRAFHVHPLRYALLLAEKAAALGASLHENTKVLGVERQGAAFRVRTAEGDVTAGHVVHCVSSLDRKLHPPSGHAVLPVATYVAVSEPIEQDAIRTKAAIADTRRAGDYYRLIHDNRILWGGRITTEVTEPLRLAERMRGDMAGTYPQLAGVRMDYAWAGLMAYALHKMPLIGRDGEGQWFATGFGGHGLNTTAMAGLLIANAIAQGDDEYRRFEAFAPRWAGGPFGRIGVQGSYWWMQLRDRIEERHTS